MLQGICYLNSLSKWNGQGEFSLTLIRSVMDSLGNPQDRIRTVHVAGTNGKGSCTAAIASILANDGNRVGAFISPHLYSVNERIIIDGAPIDDETLNSALLHVENVTKQQQIVISYFEAITAAAFLIFKEKDLDWAVIEVGLGGRLDATNVIASSKVAVITSIDFDHTQLLGNTLGAIAGEKAGVMRAGQPVICGRMSPDSSEALKKKALEVGAQIEFLGLDFNNKFNNLSRISTFIQNNAKQFEFTSMLDGRHQVDNMSVAIRAARHCGASIAACQHGVSSVFWPGRLEQGVLFGRKLVMDAAHNPAGIDSMLSFLHDRNIKQATFVFGVLETKDWRAMVKKISSFAGSVIILKPDSSIAVSADQIKDEFELYDVSSAIAAGVGELLTTLDNAEEKLPIVACGSIYMIGALRAKLVELPESRCNINDRPIWQRSNVAGKSSRSNF